MTIFSSRRCLALMLMLVAASAVAQETGRRREGGSPVIDCYISTGDNHWLGVSLPIDSKASIAASFDMLADVYGVRRIYWRGLEEAAWVETAHVREENCRYASFWEWIRRLYKELDPDKVAVKAAHERGMEIWGVGNLFDWGSPADTPCFNDYPYNSESRLRIEHPEWVPVDRHCFRRQGGPIELAYPEARKTLVDLHVRHALHAGYDGVVFLTYAENYGMRFQDEFGFNDPVVEEFKRRYRIDLRSQDFTRFASRFDWYSLRGEYVTRFLRELKAELARHGKKLGMFVNPQQPHYPQPWNVPVLMLTAGRIYMDLETWVREGIVDLLLVYGNCDRRLQARTVENCLWMTRRTKTEVSFLTSGPFDPGWRTFQDRGVATVIAFGPDDMYLNRSRIPPQPPSSLRGGDVKLKMRVLAQVINGDTKAAVSDVAPLAEDPNLIVRRMALLALGKLQDSAGIPVIEEGLSDPENGVRCAAALALRTANRPESVPKLLESVERFGNHMLCEVVVSTLARCKPPPRARLVEALKKSPNPRVRSTAIRALEFMMDDDLVPVFIASLDDADRYVRYTAAKGLAAVRGNPKVVEVLIAATRHEDVVVSDRAAVSLGAIASRNEKKPAQLRPRMLEALAALFEQFGDGCKRADADWGYRPVGNALLDMGGEGEAVLRSFMKQTSDRRLAELAWVVLELPQRTGQFTIVTEKENEEAFRKRPRKE